MPDTASPFVSPVYGPVTSWRYGRSLGIDLLLQDSICSFDCVYCQLGKINRHIDEQDIFVPTGRVVEELARVDWNDVDIVTLSGNGEPTLALNAGEVIRHIRETYGKPVLVLTNSTWLHDAATRERLHSASIVDCKLDAATDQTLAKVNRPTPGIGIRRIVEGIKALRADSAFRGKISIQTMLMPLNRAEFPKIAEIISEIQPDEVQLNTPRRPKPDEWFVDSRGSHGGQLPVDARLLKTLPPDELEGMAEFLQGHAGIPVRIPPKCK